MQKPGYKSSEQSTEIIRLTARPLRQRLTTLRLGPPPNDRLTLTVVADQKSVQNEVRSVGFGEREGLHTKRAKRWVRGFARLR